MSKTKPFALDQEVLPRDYYENPYPYFHEVRANDPVHWSEQWDAWLLTRYDDVAIALRDWERFSSSGKSRRTMRDFPRELRQALEPLEENFSTGLINSDPPAHTRLRKLLARIFVPREIKRLRPHIQSIVDDLIDAVADKGGMDLAQDFAYLLPTTIIAQMLGVPLKDRERFNTWADNINAIHTSRRAMADRFANAQDNLLEMQEYFRRLYAQRKDDPRDDVLTRLAEADEDGDRFDEGELLATTVTLLMAGYETTISLISTGMLWLMRNPEQLELLKADHSLIHSAVEELLRYESPVQRQLRVVTQDLELGGKSLKKGDLAACMIGAANRDPAQFPDPDRLEIRREDNKHVAFGYGIHFCLGGPLARVEGDVAISTLLRRLPNIRLADGPPVWEENVLLRTLQTLPVVF